jgi:hypothetical protein
MRFLRCGDRLLGPFLWVRWIGCKGLLDPLLLRPSPPLLQIAGSELAHKDLAHVGLRRYQSTGS